MTTRSIRLAVALMVTLLGLPAASRGQDPSPPHPASRIRVVLNAAAWVGSQPSYGGRRSVDEYGEQTAFRTSYETSSAWGPDLALQVTLWRGLGLRAGYSLARRDASGALDVSRPHPLYFGRPRTASASRDALSYREQAAHLDLAWSGSAGRLDWSIFGGATLFRVEAEVFGDPVFDDVYPFDTLAIAEAPAVTAESKPVGFNVGAGLDYRFGRSGRFGLGAQVVYSRADADLAASGDVETSTFEAGGLQVAAGIRLYF